MNGAAEHFDFIVVGAGSSGATIASRLSEDPGTRVLLIEAGRRSHPLSWLPASFGLLINNPAANWCYRSEPEAGTRNREIPVPRGKLLGGSSAINGLVWVRGQPLDYDTWAQMGNRGWSYEDVLPMFRRLESYAGGDPDVRGRDGPVRITEAEDDNPIYPALFAAAREVGIPVNEDYNGGAQEGLCRTQTSIHGGRRSSVAAAYLKAAEQRPNLRIVTEAQTERLLIEGRRVTGVSYRLGGTTRTALANAETIVSCGAVASPQLLELSGIGRPDVIEPLGLTVNHALEGVGERLRDHINARLSWRLTRPELSYNARMKGWRRAGQALRYLVSRRGFLSLPASPVVGFFRTRPELEAPDIQSHIVPYVVKDAGTRELEDWPGITMSVYAMRPESLGSIHARSPDPAVGPAIRFNFLSDPLDRRTLLDGIRFVRRLANARAMDDFRGDEMTPGADVESDEAVLDYVAANCQTAFHPVGTCRMAPGPDGVVDERLRVRGLDGIRVADASIMPTLVSGNTNAASIMIGEKAAQMLREDHALPGRTAPATA